VTLARATFRELPGALERAGGEPLAGALLDLGMSSRQIDDPERGMSFQAGGPLDLRMDRTRGVPAAERLHTVEEHELERVLRELGDVPGARRIARAIVEAASTGRLETTKDLVLAIDRAGARAGSGFRHPRRYAQVFQALRMWVNDEPGELDAVLAWLPEAIRPGGVVVTLAYHSGEDRKIKQALRGARITRPARRLPEIAGTRPPEGPWDELTHRVVTPSQAEKDRNPRARSARLRAFRRKSQ
jgi:16S rRNA (cytosine1402-N4)-methyltransferase